MIMLFGFHVLERCFCGWTAPILDTHSFAGWTVPLEWNCAPNPRRLTLSYRNCGWLGTLGRSSFLICSPTQPVLAFLSNDLRWSVMFVVVCFCCSVHSGSVRSGVRASRAGTTQGNIWRPNLCVCARVPGVCDFKLLNDMLLLYKTFPRFGTLSHALVSAAYKYINSLRHMQISAMLFLNYECMEETL